MSFLEAVGAGAYEWASEYNCIDAFTTGFAAISTAEVEQIAVGFGVAFDADRRPSQRCRGWVGGC